MKKVILITSMIISFNIFAEANMRKCLLLPIKDNLGDALSFKVYSNVEEYLKMSEWCYFRSNSEIMNILANHRRNLDNVLENPKVIKIISEKTESGSLIKIDIVKEVNGVDIRLKIIGDNGEDIYFKEKVKSTNDDYIVISRIIKNWLNIYASQIPYEGKVVGVLGSQLTIDAGKARSIFQGNEIIIVRPVGKKRHPLLKEIVDWETEKIAEGKIIFATRDQSQANVVKYSGKRKLKIGDWVILKRNPLKKNEVEKIPYDAEGEKYKFGKMGTMSLHLLLGSVSANVERSGNIKKMSGRAYGIDLDVNLWVTRKYWAALGINRVVGTMKGREGIGATVENSTTVSSFNARFGYKYLPMGFFNGPQVDFYVGFANQKYSMETLSAHSLTEISFSGLLFGAVGTLPIQNIFRMKAELAFMFNPGYEELAAIYGEDDSANTYKMKFGGNYLYAPNMTLDIFYNIVSSKASFLSPVRSIQGKVSSLNIGATYTF